jgi:hypothetical protein
MISVQREGEWRERLALWVVAAWAEACRVARRVDRKVCRVVLERRIIAITAASVAGVVVTVKWQGVGGFILAQMSNWAKDASEIVIDIEIFEEEL